ncbi:MAG: YraN family protein [Clostridia bacterium]|nr:YraN family protein [Clostridia bacterium]
MEINKQGFWGEIFAVRYMRDRGYDPVTINFRSRVGEIDIVAVKDGYICFTEVKTRGPNSIAQPKEAVDTEKQQNIIAASKIFARAHPYTEQPRFDVCEVYLDENMKPTQINYIENAFNG